MSNEDPDEGETPCIVGVIRGYYRDKINPIILNEKNTEEVKKERLVEELRRVRCHYNLWNSFSSKFVLSFLLGLIGLLVGLTESADKVAIIFAIGFFYIVTIFCQWLFVCAANIYYEEMEVVKAELEKIKESKSKCEEMKVSEAELNEMKLIKDELEKINNTIQPNPKKTSIRIYNRSSVRRSNFGR